MTLLVISIFLILSFLCIKESHGVTVTVSP